MKCPGCGQTPYKVEGSDNYECDCGKEERSIYQNHCWNCKEIINEVNSSWSKTKDMGLVCKFCGKDLTEWKNSRR